ncbi:MAG: AAA family ATPase [Mogibacterium sp.]|nr:AAA family ATPase [Mogibacterium sp.]
MLENIKFVDAQELLMTPLKRSPFLVDDLVPSGVSIIGGDEKTGKSWMMLHLALCIATGQDFLGHSVHQGSVFYLSLEDSMSRLQDRLFKLTDEIPFERLYLATKSATLEEGLIEQITRIVEKRPDIRLFIIDTLQLARGDDNDISYAGDYADIAKIIEFSREYGVDVFIVHHVRKQGDSRNIFNKFNGTKGITGAVDTMFLLEKENEYSDKATLYVKGRDLQYRELTIRFADCKWELVSEKTLEQITHEHTPEIVFSLIDFLKERRSWRGSATELLEELGDKSVAPNVLTKYVNQYRLSLLLDEGIEYTYRRTHAEGRVLSFQICDGCDGRDGQEDNSR